MDLPSPPQTPLCPPRPSLSALALQAMTVHPMLPGTQSVHDVVSTSDGEATGSSGVEGTAVGNVQVALGNILLGREKMSLRK